MPLALPIRAVAAVLGCLALAELALLPRTSPIPAHLAVHVVVLGTLLLLPRRPLAVLALILLEIFLVKELRLNGMVSVSLALMTPFAAFAAAALAGPGPILALLAAHVAWRATLPSGDIATIVVTSALLAAAVLAGALLRGRHQRLTTLRAERDRLRAALADGPGAAATAEQLRMWGEVEQRIAPVVEALPALVEQATTRARLEALRNEASDALRTMQATVRMLGTDEPPHPLVVTTRPGPRRTVAPLAAVAAVLVAGMAIEVIVRREAALALLPAIALPLVPLLIPRVPIAASAALAVGLVASSATALAVTYDLVLLLAMVVVGALAGPRRAVVAFVLLQAGAAVALATDPAMPWPAVSYVSQALLLTGGWSVGALLRGVAVEQRHVARGLEATANELDALVRQAVQRERVRLAHELHDLVGHALTAVAIQAAAGLTQLRQDQRLERAPLRAAARQGVVELQRLAAVVRPARDLAADLERIVAATGQTVALELPEGIELDDELRHTVVCVAAEALTNAAKHAAGAPIRVSLTHTRHAVALEVVDEGGPPTGLPSGGNGIASMARRVRAAGGTFASGPRPGGGWAVSAVLPSAGDTIARRG